MSEFFTLSQLNQMLQEKVKLTFPSKYWIVAETSDVRINNGHCYLEFIEKNEQTSALLAKARGYIWSNTFSLLKPYFEKATGQTFISGIRILVRVGVEFHPVYGFALNVCDIDPTYTMGNMQLKRQAILCQLKKDGIIDLNKELQINVLPQRIAVISSSSAAGYEDFLNQLLENPYGFVFYPHLFSSIMQGEQTETSIISALDKIYEHIDSFDAVVIIRGGGAASDISSFDSYLLAMHCAQFPLPIVVGIGHERDETILDYIAFHREKTPTAVAEYFIRLSCQFSERLSYCKNGITKASLQLLENTNSCLKHMETYFPLITNSWIEIRRRDLDVFRIELKNASQRFLSQHDNNLRAKEFFLKLSSPEYILAKGYSITLKDGKIVKFSDQLKSGDLIETVLKEGRIESTVSNRLVVDNRK